MPYLGVVEQIPVPVVAAVTRVAVVVTGEGAAAVDHDALELELEVLGPVRCCRRIRRCAAGPGRGRRGALSGERPHVELEGEFEAVPDLHPVVGLIVELESLEVDQQGVRQGLDPDVLGSVTPVAAVGAGVPVREQERQPIGSTRILARLVLKMRNSHMRFPECQGGPAGKEAAAAAAAAGGGCSTRLLSPSRYSSAV